MNLAECFEWLRQRCGIETPLEKWLIATELAVQEDEPGILAALGPRPPAGKLPGWQPDPSNYKLKSWIQSACDRINRECSVDDVQANVDLPLQAVQSAGPYYIDLSSIPGFPDRELITAKRFFWSTDPTDNEAAWNRLKPVHLDQLDALNDQYMNEGPGTPTRAAVEGYQLALLPGPDSDGTLRLKVGAQLLAPEDNSDGFTPLPSAYDSAILYVALVEGAKSLTQDNEMAERAKAYGPEATEAIISIAKWYDNQMADEFAPGTQWNANVVRRYRRG